MDGAPSLVLKVVFDRPPEFHDRYFVSDVATVKYGRSFKEEHRGDTDAVLLSKDTHETRFAQYLGNPCTRQFRTQEWHWPPRPFRIDGSAADR